MTDTNAKTSQVAQQVMGLFKGAIELEQDTQIQNDTAATEVKTANTNGDPQVTLKVCVVMVIRPYFIYLSF